MASLDLDRCPFLSAAFEYIARRPGCTKRDVVMGTYPGHRYKDIPNRTYSYRNAALSRLLRAGLVRNEPGGRGYRLYINSDSGTKS